MGLRGGYVFQIKIKMKDENYSDDPCSHVKAYASDDDSDTDSDFM